jgi:hypothetical protein
MRAPYPYFGGKARAAPLIWDALGDVGNFVEPFAGSLAVLLGRPHPPHLETVNDKDGFVCNFWRAVQHDPDAVAHYADQPSNECDLHARHSWLVPQREGLTARLEGDPEYYDAKIAGWWCWGLCCWIGSGWCSGTGSWHVIDSQLTHLGNAGQGVQRQLTHLGNAGQGVQRKLTHLGDAGRGVQRKRTQLSQLWGGVGVQSLRARNEGIYTWMHALCDRLRYVRVTCGDWTRVLGPSVTWKHGRTGVVLDPPYSHSERTRDLYSVEADIAPEVEAWCLANGDNPLLRVVLCGYEGEYTLPGWRVVPWKATAGYSGQNHDRDTRNQHRERLWLSPHCTENQLTLFGGV